MNFKSLALASVLSVATVTPVGATPQTSAQFPDVQPTAWSYQAILNLRERYGCAVGFPDGSFRPGVSATREQVAALVNHCLDNIVTYVDEKDAALANALRSEFRVEIAKIKGRVQTLEVATQRKNLGVGNYVGVGLTLGSRPNLVEDNSSTYAGVGVQGRFPILNSGAVNAVSVRPFVAFTGSDFGGVLVNGGASVTYDFSLGQKVLSNGTKVSTTNLYGGVGYNASQSYGNYRNTNQASSSNAIGVVGLESSIGNNAVVFADVKLPFEKNDLTDTYELQSVVGLGLKF